MGNERLLTIYGKWTSLDWCHFDFFLQKCLFWNPYMYIVQFLKDECICLRMWVFLTVLLSQIFKVLIWSLEFDIYAMIRKYKFQVNFPISMCFKDYDKLYIRRLCIKIVFDIQMQHLTKLKWISHPKRNVYKHWEK